MRPDIKNLAQVRVTSAGDPRAWVPMLLGALAVANLLAGWFVWQTPGGSAGDLETQISASGAQVQRSAANLTRLRALVKKVETARKDQEQFVAHYFIDRRTASSSILTELTQAAAHSGLTPKEHGFSFEPVDGSDVFTMMTITANYEGRYSDLRQFISALDRSERFLIIEDVTAAPQQEPGKLTARFKINAFVRDSARIVAPGGPPVRTGAKAEQRAVDLENARLEVAETWR